MKLHGKKMVLSSFLAVFFYASGSIAVFDKLHAEERGAKSPSEVKNISVKQAWELTKEWKDVFVLDVRTRDEYNEGHIKGANLIPVQELAQNIHKIRKWLFIVFPEDGAPRHVKH